MHEQLLGNLCTRIPEVGAAPAIYITFPYRPAPRGVLAGDASFEGASPEGSFLLRDDTRMIPGLKF